MKAKKIIITIVFALLMLGLKAQDHYEYMSILYKPFVGGSKYEIIVTQDNKVSRSDGKVSEGIGTENFSPAIELMNKMGKDGWEAYSNAVLYGTNGTMLVYYSLRRKK